LDEQNGRRTAREIFGVLVELPPEKRSEYLSSHVPEPVRREVEALLVADQHAEDFVSLSVKRAAQLTLENGLLHFGPYSAIRLLGRGGMGSVYLCARSDGAVERQAAVKVLPKVLETPALVERFHAERQILAGFSHPGIATMYDAGSTEDGCPWFAMEYVDGESIDEYVASRRLDIRARVRLFLKVLEAVQYAHRHLIIHRDLKPANILVTKDGAPKLLDFGIAKVIESGMQTGRATLICTPDFAAPEQIRGEAATTATDTFLAGAVLFQLLTGKNPRDLAGLTPAQAEQVICERDVVRPSQLNPAISRDLDNIVLMAMRREPERRYASLTLLSLDLQRYLEGLPVSATANSVGYLTRRFIARHRVTVAATVFCALALTGGLAAASYQAALARRHFQEVRAMANSFLFDFESRIHDLAGATEARAMVIHTAQKYLDGLYAEKPGDRELMREMAQSYDKLGVLQGSTFAANTGEYRASIENFRRAIALRLRLGDATSKDPKLRRGLVRLYAVLAIVCMSMGRNAEAREAGLAGVRSAEDFRRFSDTQDAMVAACNGYRTYASVLAEIGDARQSREYFDRAIREVGRWSASHPEDAASRTLFVDAMYNLSEAQDLFGDFAASAASAKQGLEQLDRLIAKSRTPQLINLEILTTGQYGKALAESDPAAWPQAKVQLLWAIELAKAQAAKDPANDLAWSHLEYERFHWGDALANRKDRAALPLLLELERELSDKHRKQPGNNVIVQMLADDEVDLSELLLRSDPGKAAKEAAASAELSDSVLRISPTDNVSLKSKTTALLDEAGARAALGQRDDALRLLDQARGNCDTLLALPFVDARTRQLAEREEKLRRELIAAPALNH